MSVPSITNKADVLIVDDHPVVRCALARLIEGEAGFRVCGEAGSISEASRQLLSSKPDLAVIDLVLGDGSGLELLDLIRRQKLPTRSLVVSARDEALYAERALRAGALGFISKQQPTSELLKAIRRVASGTVYLSPRMTERVLNRAVGIKERVEGSPHERLTGREREVFEYIGRGVPTRGIARRLHLSPKTIETYRENIKAKLNLRNGNELIRHAVMWTMEKPLSG